MHKQLRISPPQEPRNTLLAPIFKVNHCADGFVPKWATMIVQESKELKESIVRPNERLDEPFVTVNTVTGDKGMKQAQDEYQRLMNNKSPKSKRK